MTSYSGPSHTNAYLLRQGMAVLDTLGAECYGAPVGQGSRSPIGAHFRHVLDHYQAFLEGLPQGRIDYDARDRERALEVDLAKAQARAGTLALELEGLAPTLMETSLTINSCTCSDPHCEPEWTSSTVRRELAFLVSHTVHHYALIGLLAQTMDIQLPEDFGVAPSTLAHRQLST